MATVGQPDPGLVILEIARELGTRRGTKAERRAELITRSYVGPSVV